MHLSQIGLQLVAAYIGQFIREQIQQPPLQEDASQRPNEAAAGRYIYTFIHTNSTYIKTPTHVRISNARVCFLFMLAL